MHIYELTKFIQHDRIDFGDQPGLRGGLHEHRRRDDLAVTSHPPHKSFGTHQLTCARIDLRLQERFELAVFDGTKKRGHHVPLFVCALANFVV